MALCAISNLTKFYGADLIFENISFEIEDGDRIGLLGSNGVGKTTLLKILMNKEDYHGGEVFVSKGIRIDYLDQIPTFPNNYTTMDILLLAFEKLFECQKKLEDLEEKMASNPSNLESLIFEYGILQSTYETLGGYRLKERLDKILVGLNIDLNMQERDFAVLSGGEKSRVLMGKILLEEPDILLLDEPSNHLDIEYMGWLEEYLQTYQGAVMIISHDRWFLKKSVNRIIELTRQKAELYNGGYEFYLEERQKRLEQRYQEWEAKKKELDKLEEQKERYLIWGRSRDSEKMFRRAKELQKRIDKIMLPEKPRLDTKKIIINSDIVGRTGNEVVKLENVGHAFGEISLFEEINLVIHYQERVAIVGPNGIGKTTLLKIMLGQLEPTSGKARLGSRVKVGYLPQSISFENEDDDLIESFQREHDITRTNARHQLAKSLFTGDDVFKRVGSLSGGEKSRLKLSIMFYGGVNVLFLDEPTNHLDIDSREKLEESLLSYDGTIIFVSHDRYFIAEIANKILEIQPGLVKLYNGGFQFWQEKRDRYLNDVLEKELENYSSEGKVAYEEKKEQERKTRRYLKEIENCENIISRCEENILKIDERLNEEEELEILQDLFEEKERLEEKLLNQLVLYEKLIKKEHSF